MATNQVDLAKLFQTVSTALQQNQSQLNQADTYNHNHGDNMVDIFNTIAQTMQENSTATPAQQFKSAATRLRTKQSGSAQYYSKSLNQAAKEFDKADGIDASNATALIQAILGGGQASSSQPGSATSDMLGSLLNGLAGAAGSKTGGGSTSSEIDWATLAAAGMEYMKSKQEGKDTLTSLMEAIMAEPDQTPTYRKDSGSIVANTLLQALSTLLTKGR